MSASQSSHGLWPLGCDLKCFSAFFSPLSETGRLEGLEGWFTLLSHWLGSGKMVFLEDRPLLRGKGHSAYFRMVSVPFPLPEAQGNFSVVVTLQA